jgi:hypothetical protein
MGNYRQQPLEIELILASSLWLDAASVGGLGSREVLRLAALMDAVAWPN